jgi:hypothetical protein
MLRDASDLMTSAVAETAGALDLKPEDAAAVKLAMLYAGQIDECTGSDDPKLAAWAARWIAPLLLTCLAELGATPAARAALAKRGGQPSGGENQLQKLRAVSGKGKPA